MSEANKNVVLDYDEYQALLKEVHILKTEDVDVLTLKNAALEEKVEYLYAQIEESRVNTVDWFKSRDAAERAIVRDREEVDYTLKALRDHVPTIRGILIAAVKDYATKTPRWYLWSRSWSDDVLKFIQSGDIDWQIPKIPEVEKDGD